MGRKGYFKGIWRCKICGTKLDVQYTICDDCIRKAVDELIPEHGVSGTARILGLHVRTLQRRLRKLGY